MNAYSGIGSRKTPEDILMKFDRIGKILANKGFTLRSGGADGADSAFEVGCDKANGKKEIFLPWKGFNGNTSLLFDPPEEAFVMTGKIHPGWHHLKQGARRLHARNCQQVLGINLDNPVQFVICYTKLDGGGTLQALRIAQQKKIPIYNFYLQKYSIKEMIKHTL